MTFDLFSARETPTMPRVTYGLLGVSSMRWPVYKKPLRVPISRRWCTRLCRFVIGSLQLCSNVLMMSRWCHFLLCHYYTSRFPLHRWRETTVMDWSSWWVDANIPTCLVPSRFHFIHPPWPPPSFSPSFFPPFLPSSLPPFLPPPSLPSFIIFLPLLTSPVHRLKTCSRRIPSHVPVPVTSVTQGFLSWRRIFIGRTTLQFAPMMMMLWHQQSAFVWLDYTLWNP